MRKTCSGSLLNRMRSGAPFAFYPDSFEPSDLSRARRLDGGVVCKVLLGVLPCSASDAAPEVWNICHFEVIQLN
jgi:hypothetical protein